MRGINVVEKDYAVFINNPNQFLAISDFTVGGGINVVENVNIIESTEALDSSKQSSYQEKRQYIAQETESLNYFKKFYPGLGVYTFMENDLIIQDVLSKKDLIKVFKRVTKAKTKYLASLNLPLHINNILNNNDFLAVLCAIPKNEDDDFDDFDIDELNIEKVVEESVDEAFKRFDLTFGILDYLVSEGILIGDMIEAGLALVDDADVTDELKEKMEAQLLKSLSDINIIALLMAAIRTEEDFTGNNIREINIDENPAHFYADELLGLSIANQIAGTKAAFNFKLYKEVKPGIIYGLPPMLDDVFAGLIAGCMTKILQD